MAVTADVLELAEFDSLSVSELGYGAGVDTGVGRVISSGDSCDRLDIRYLDCCF